jgi:hypothetical protein
MTEGSIEPTREDLRKMVRDPYSTADQALGLRILGALERIATALERQADADPLAMLDAAMQDAGDDVPADMLLGRQGPIASNGFTVIYKHPEPGSGLEIVARRDPKARGGYSVGVEKA